MLVLLFFISVCMIPNGWTTKRKIGILLQILFLECRRGFVQHHQQMQKYFKVLILEYVAEFFIDYNYIQRQLHQDYVLIQQEGCFFNWTLLWQHLVWKFHHFSIPFRWGHLNYLNNLCKQLASHQNWFAKLNVQQKEDAHQYLNKKGCTSRILLVVEDQSGWFFIIRRYVPASKHYIITCFNLNIFGVQQSEFNRVSVWARIFRWRFFHSWYFYIMSDLTWNIYDPSLLFSDYNSQQQRKCDSQTSFGVSFNQLGKRTNHLFQIILHCV